jgi:DNA-binding response OmpR family regulator
MQSAPLPALLLVESDRAVRFVVARLLSRSYAVTPCGSFEDASSALDATSFDTIICEVGANDVPAYAKLAVRAACSRVIVVLTAWTGDGLCPSPDAVLREPFTMDELCEAIADDPRSGVHRKFGR